MTWDGVLVLGLLWWWSCGEIWGGCSCGDGVCCGGGCGGGSRKGGGCGGGGFSGDGLEELEEILVYCFG